MWIFIKYIFNEKRNGGGIPHTLLVVVVKWIELELIELKFNWNILKCEYILDHACRMSRMKISKLIGIITAIPITKHKIQWRLGFYCSQLVF